MTIETERLLLREYTIEDYDSLYEKGEGISGSEERDFLCFCYYPGRMGKIGETLID